MSEQNYDQVICPDCNHQFTAVPVNVQERIAELEQQLKELHGDLEITGLRLAAAWKESYELRKAMRDAVDDDFMTSKYMIRLADLVRQRT